MKAVLKKREPIREVAAKIAFDAAHSGEELQHIELSLVEAKRLFEEGPCYSIEGLGGAIYGSRERMIKAGRCRAYTGRHAYAPNGDYLLFVWEPEETE